MNQKIEGVPAAAIRGVGALAGRAAAGGERSRPVEAGDGGASLRLTGEAAGLQMLQRELASAPAIDPARVRAALQALQSGDYRIDAESIADRMLELELRLGAGGA